MDSQNKRSRRSRQAVNRLLGPILPTPLHNALLRRRTGSGKTSELPLTHTQLDASGIPYEERGIGTGTVAFHLRPADSTPSASPPPAAPSRSSGPRPLEPYELAAWRCPHDDCGRTASAGTHHWDDRGPHQLLSNHVPQCPAGHHWRNSTDGG